ncbi:hypothetical protein SOVF_180310 [Spinacia oleracea]|nr:hypothetical protein SOVF_180310 [Spinacia oleracea]
MSEEYGEGNLVAQTEAFFSEVFSSWTDSMQALVTSEQVLQQAEEAHVVSRCINSLAIKACSDPSLFGWPVSGQLKNSKEKSLWNGISSANKSHITSTTTSSNTTTAATATATADDWWYEDASSLSFSLYKRLIKAVEARGMKPERVSGSIMFYATKNIPLFNKQLENDTAKQGSEASTAHSSEVDQGNLLEDIVNLLPAQKGVTPTKFFLRLLKTAINLHCNPPCLETLEKRVGAQLDQATLVDLLIPNTGYALETLYDIDCVQRIADHFMKMQLGVSETSSPTTAEDGVHLINASESIASMTLVAQLVDSYLAEVAPDVNVKPPKFQALAAVIPDYARPRYDAFYHAVDIYLKAHPWLTESEREQICRLMNCQKLSLEASTHAAQNERLPLRMVVQVLFFEQLRLRTQISGWFFLSDNVDSSQNRDQDEIVDQDRALVVAGDVRNRVSELEKEYQTIKKEIQKMAKTKKKWSIFSRMFARPKPRATVQLIHPKPALIKAQHSSLLKNQELENKKFPEIENTNQN